MFLITARFVFTHSVCFVKMDLSQMIDKFNEAISPVIGDIYDDNKSFTNNEEYDRCWKM